MKDLSNICVKCIHETQLVSITCPDDSKIYNHYCLNKRFYSGNNFDMVTGELLAEKKPCTVARCSECQGLYFEPKNGENATRNKITLAIKRFLLKV